jgi:hypothetical protein
VSSLPPEKNGLKKYLPGGNGDKPMAPESRRRILTISIVAFILGIVVIPSLFNSKSTTTLSYSKLLADAHLQQVNTAMVNRRA